MHVAAIVRPGGAVWPYWDRDLLAVSVWTEKKPDAGEDAEPLLVHHRPTGSGLVSVFDGVGGAGAASAGRSGRGVERSGAWTGARAARATVEEWYLRSTEQGLPRTAESLRQRLGERLGELRGSGRRTVLGTMRRELPTTIAALDYRIGADSVSWQALWAGDSRCFLLTAEDGLQQLSVDDADDDDALTLLTEDPPMTNMVCVDRAFRVNTASGSVAQPCVLVCATDGFFGYLRGPADFEHLLLSTLLRARTATHWGELLVEHAAAYSGDDASLTLLCAGFTDLGQVRQHLVDRARHVEQRYWEPLRRASGIGDRDSFTAARAESWSRYRIGYERRMPRREGAPR